MRVGGEQALAERVEARAVGRGPRRALRRLERLRLARRGRGRDRLADGEREARARRARDWPTRARDANLDPRRLERRAVVQIVRVARGRLVPLARRGGVIIVALALLAACLAGGGARVGGRARAHAAAAVHVRTAPVAPARLDLLVPRRNQLARRRPRREQPARGDRQLGVDRLAAPARLAMLIVDTRAAGVRARQADALAARARARGAHALHDRAQGCVVRALQVAAPLATAFAAKVRGLRERELHVRSEEDGGGRRERLAARRLKRLSCVRARRHWRAQHAQRLQRARHARRDDRGAARGQQQGGRA